MIQRLLDNPAALIGIFRAAALAAATFGVGWAADDAKVQAVTNLLAVLIPVISLLFTGASSKAVNSQVQAALMQEPPK